MLNCRSKPSYLSKSLFGEPTWFCVVHPNLDPTLGILWRSRGLSFYVGAKGRQWSQISHRKLKISISHDVVRYIGFRARCYVKRQFICRFSVNICCACLQQEGSRKKCVACIIHVVQFIKSSLLGRARGGGRRWRPAVAAGGGAPCARSTNFVQKIPDGFQASIWVP